MITLIILCSHDSGNEFRIIEKLKLVNDYHFHASNNIFYLQPINLFSNLNGQLFYVT